MPQITILQVCYLWVAISTLNETTMERIQIRQELHQPNQQKYQAFIMQKNDSTGGWRASVHAASHIHPLRVTEPCVPGMAEELPADGQWSISSLS